MFKRSLSLFRQPHLSISKSRFPQTRTFAASATHKMKENYTQLYPNEQVSLKVGDYCANHSTPIPQDLLDLHTDVSTNHEKANYMISPFQAQFQIFMAKALGAKRSCFIGFSAIGWSEAVGADGHVTTLEFSPEYAQQAKDNLARHNAKNVNVMIGDARKSYVPPMSPTDSPLSIISFKVNLPSSIEDLAMSITTPFDLIFIDADKESYPHYLRQILEFSDGLSEVPLLKEGGVIMADNVLRRALVVDSSESNPWSKIAKEKTWKEGDMDALREFNKMMVEEKRLETFLLPMFDGVGLARLK